MKVLNFGSINIDHVYFVDHFVRPGETLSSYNYQVFAGGKGFNQSVALAQAGAQIYHAGMIGQDGGWLKRQLTGYGVDVAFLDVLDDPTGHAIIQVNQSGENAIVLHGGANQRIAESDIANVMSSFSAGDYLLVQNEISSVAGVIRKAAEQGLSVVFNPAPMTATVKTYPLELVNIFILNEIEAQGLTNEITPESIRAVMCNEFPRAATVLTLGSSGAMYFNSETKLHQPAEVVTPVDTTAAGDTFIGFFLAQLMKTGNIQKALELGCRAAAVCVTRLGAADSIPGIEELEVIQPDASSDT